MASQRHLVDAYEPIEDILARPKVRILRALRWFGWVSGEDLWLALDVPEWNTTDADADNSERNRMQTMLGYLTRTGRVETCQRGVYRLTDLGRADLARTLRKYEESIGAQRRAA